MIMVDSRLAIIAVAVFAIGAPPANTAASDDLPGRVVDKAGLGAAKARVWAVGGRWETPRTVASATTDDQGRFVLPHAWANDGEQDSVYLGLFVRGGDGRIGWPGTVWRNSPDAVKIELAAVGDVQGKLTDQDGRPIAGAAVAPTIIVRSADPKFQQDYIRLSPELADAFRTTTAADGTFVLKAIPQGAQVHATFTAAGFGSPTISWDTTKPVPLVLDGRVGRIEGQLKPPDARGLSGQLAVSLRSHIDPGSLVSAPFQVVAIKTAKAGADGSFRFDDLQPGQYELYLESTDAPFAAQPIPLVEVGRGATAHIEVPLERLLSIKGRVVDAQTGKGLAEVALQALLVERQSLQHGGQAKTDADGRYSVAVRPGTVMIQPRNVPKTHLGLSTNECPKQEIKADSSWPDLKLARAMELDGTVIDAAGQPVAGAEVFLVAPDPGGFFGGTGPTLTSTGGTFSLEKLDPDDRLSLRARTKEATTDGAVVIRPKEKQGQDKLTITIDPKYAFRVRGLVTDRNGKRIAGAKVSLWWTRMYASEKVHMGIGNILETYTTNETGWFVFRALWPGDRYKVVVEANGRDKADTPEVTGTAGQTHDFGKIMLLDTGGHLAGRVVGSDGKPIAGATVFNRGDGAEPVTTRTDDRGQFRLEGLFAGSKYAFVRKEGYRFTGLKADGDADDLTIKLLQAGEPPPGRKPGELATFAEERAFAASVLTRLWEKLGKDPARRRAFICINDMARLDFDRAMEWSAESGHRYDDQVRLTAAQELAESDATVALKLVDQVGDKRSRQRILQQLADRFNGTDRDKALLFAEEAVKQAGKLDQADRARADARAGAVLIQLGRAEAGRKLIDQAVKIAEDLGIEGGNGYIRAVVAGAIAPFDLEHALALIGPIKDENDRDRMGFVARSIAATDPDRAVAMVDAMRGNSNTPETVKTEIAYRIGAERPVQAVKIIESMKGYSADKWQAEAFGWLAVAIAPRDREQAFTLIDRALAIPIDKPDAFQSWVNFGAAMASAARIASCARQIGYPDMESVVMRVMATRPSDSQQGGFNDPAMQMLSASIAAVPLALIDRAAARQVLDQIEMRGGPTAAGLSDAVREHWLEAWALVDLKKAESLFEAELASGDAEKLSDRSAGYFKMVEMLATPPHRRESALTGLSAWSPGPIE